MTIATMHPLRAFRKSRGLSQEAAGAAVGITQSHWHMLELEKAYASPSVAKRISDFTGIGLEQLLNFGDNEAGPKWRKRGKKAA